MEAFSDDEIFRRVIEKRIKMGDNMSDNGIRKMLKVFTGTQCVSNFRPTASASIYTHFLPNGGKTWDMSGGYGGRLLGAWLAGVDYVTTEPCGKTYDGLKRISEFLSFDCELLKRGSEEADLPIHDIDLCFTSPPYFDCEKYSDEPTQSYLKFPTREAWLNDFMGQTISNCYSALKPDGTLLLNIQNVKSYPDLVQDIIYLCNIKGFNCTETWGLHLSNLAGGGLKTEPILVFKKNEGGSTQ
jgi:hypothetical protein